MKTLAIIGSTGSIGKAALSVFGKNKKKFNLVYLAANTNLRKLNLQNAKYKPKHVFLLNGKKKSHSHYKKNFLTTEDALSPNQKKIDYVISGVSSYDAISVNLKLLKIAKNLLIANKETIICGGNFFLNIAKKNNCRIIPIDSEHYCLDFFLKNFKNLKKIKKFYIVASGGPFFESPIKKNHDIDTVTNHPTWKMGREISVNSSTFANKVLELFEAKILFNIPNNKLGIRVDRTSNIHAVIKFDNNFYLPILHKPKMEIPISEGLNLNNGYDIDTKDFKFSLLSPNIKKFPLIKLGFKILSKYGHIGMIFFTVFNSKMVNLYLNKKIKYGDISNSLVKAFNNKKIIQLFNKKITNINDVFNIIKIAEKLKL